MQFLQLDYFANHVNETFALDLGGANHDLTLVQASPMPFRNRDGLVRAPFRLLFRSTLQIVFPQRTYSLTNATTGQLSIFLVPIGRDVQGVLYEAVFN
ncbi:MAG: hypothetical protein HOQ35_07035 [Acidobacteriaceae bacterium]|nr:hypothetical protein [Acidobacteriaceae bacterium]